MKWLMCSMWGSRYAILIWNTAYIRSPAKEVIPYRIYPVLSPAWKADGYDELGIIYDRYLDLLVTYVVEVNPKRTDTQPQS